VKVPFDKKLHCKNKPFNENSARKTLPVFAQLGVKSIEVNNYKIMIKNNSPTSIALN
jgi:hypothetical protein